MKIFGALCLTLAIMNFDCQLITASVIKNESYSAITLFADGQNINLQQNKDSDSWLQMVLVFAKKSTANLIERITNSEVSTPEIAITTTPKPIVCPSEYIPIGSFCYFFSKEVSNWQNALASCKSKGADLAHPSTEEKNTQLVNYIKTNFPKIDYWYLGASDLAQEGTWIWAHDNSKLSWTNWLSKQPDDAGKNEDCLHYWMIHNWGWNDMGCATLTYYIYCQTKSVEISLTSRHSLEIPIEDENKNYNLHRLSLNMAILNIEVV
ncbi:Fc fragment of IgE, low affinity II, receptor for (CD23) [Chamberlinius hualienensis]